MIPDTGHLTPDLKLNGPVKILPKCQLESNLTQTKCLSCTAEFNGLFCPEPYFFLFIYFFFLQFNIFCKPGNYLFLEIVVENIDYDQKSMP